MLEWIVCRAAYRKHARRTALATVRAEYEALRDEVIAAADTTDATRALAGHWMRLHRDREQQLRTLAADDRGHMATAALTLLDAPIFAGLPMAAFGLRRVAHDEPVAIWLGRPAQLVEAAQALVLRGCTTHVADDREHIDVYEHDRHIAILLVAPASVTGDLAFISPRSRPSRPWRTLGQFLLAAALIALLAIHLATATSLGAAALAAWIVDRLLQRRARQRSRRHQMRLAPVAATSPYRGPVARAPIDTETMIDTLERAAHRVTRRHRDLVVDDDVVIRGAAAPATELTSLDLHCTDIYRAMSCVHTLVATTGPLDVHTRTATTTILSPDRFPTWAATRRRDDDRRSLMLTALADGHRRACALIDSWDRD